MKKILILLMLVAPYIQAQGGVQDTSLTEKSVREKILGDIQQNLNVKNKIIDSTITKIDFRISMLDSAIRTTGNHKERIDKLVERVQILEEKQKALEQNEINVYEANYQSAVINLVSMDREIKPLILFHATKDFFNALTETSNPNNYEGFRAGFEKFRVYIDNTKETNATLKTISSIINATGNVSFGIPIVGAYSQLLFSGMADYVNSIGHKKRELKVEAEKMFAVTASLSQFVTDKNLVENEWDGITQSLEEMQGHYESVIDKNMGMLKMERKDLTCGYTRECDASKRYAYLTTLRQRAADYVLEKKKENPKDWKEDIYYQLMDVQSLKVRYGDITYRIKHHINKYDDLLAKYKNNKEIGVQVGKLEGKLNQLKATFDDTFEPIQYVHAATQMYKVL
jgi:hypothetical protein